MKQSFDDAKIPQGLPPCNGPISATKPTDAVNRAIVRAVWLRLNAVQVSGRVYLDEAARVTLRRNGIGAAALRMALNALADDGRIELDGDRSGRLVARILVDENGGGGVS